MDVLVKITKWEKHNPRKDVKNPTWFSFNNRMVEDDDLFGLNHGEFKAWIYLLSKASQKQCSEVLVSYQSAYRKSNISPKDFKSSLQKLESLGMVTVHVTDTLRARDVHVPLHYITLHNKTLHNTTPEIGSLPNVSVRLDLDALYQLYPRKEGKAKGVEKLKAVVKTPEDFELVKQAILRYSKHCQSSGTEAKFIKHFSTFMTSWRDWLEADVGTSTMAAPKTGIEEWVAKQEAGELK